MKFSQLRFQYINYYFQNQYSFGDEQHCTDVQKQKICRKLIDDKWKNMLA